MSLVPVIGILNSEMEPQLLWKEATFYFKNVRKCSPALVSYGTLGVCCCAFEKSHSASKMSQLFNLFQRLAVNVHIERVTRKEKL